MSKPLVQRSNEVLGIGHQAESEFSLRKARISFVCLLGHLFATPMLPVATIALVMLPAIAEFGWTRTEFSYALAIMMWCGAVTMPLVGRVADRFGVRPVILVGALVVGVVTLWLSHQSANLWRFYLCYAILGIFGSTIFAYTKVVACLFDRHRGKALAAYGLACVLVMACLPQLANAFSSHFGWRGIYSGFGVIILAIVPALYFVLEEPIGSVTKGQSLHGTESSAKSISVVPIEGMTAADARRTKDFWLLVTGAVLVNAPATAWMLHAVAFMIGRGFTQQTAVNVVSLSALIAAFAGVIGGYVADRVPTVKIFVPFATVSAIGFLLQCFVSVQFGGVRLLILAGSMGGFAMGCQISMVTYFYTRLFGVKAFSEIYATHMAILQVTCGFAPPLFGALFERTGSYNGVLVLMILCHIVSAGLFLIVGPYRYGIAPGVVKDSQFIGED